MGYADTEVITKELGNAVSAAALSDLERYEVAVKLLVEGRNPEPFRGVTLPPLDHQFGRKEKLIQLSRDRFAMPRAGSLRTN